MSSSYILLWLEGPLQSWGYDSRFGRRETLNFPTKSGVLGLICSALGASGEQKDLLSILSDLDMQVLAFSRISQKGKLNLTQPLLRDFHMVGSGYNPLDPWQSLLTPKKNDGKKAVGGGAKLTYRFYLQDAVFAVLLQLPESLVERVPIALQSPCWDIYLGRKTCIPTEIVFQGVYESNEDAFFAAEKLAAHKQLSVRFKVLQGNCEGGEVLTLNDIPVQFGQHKIYRDRQVTIITTG